MKMLDYIEKARIVLDEIKFLLPRYISKDILTSYRLFY